MSFWHHFICSIAHYISLQQFTSRAHGSVWITLGHLFLLGAGFRPVEGPLGYKDRGNRIEGFFEKDVSFMEEALTLELVSLTHGRFMFEISSNQSVTLTPDSISTALGDSLHIRAVPRYGVPYYQMDTIVPLGASFEWPVSEVLGQYPLPSTRIGVYGWIQYGGGDRTFIPLSVEQGAQLAPIETVELVLRVPVDIEDVRYRQYPADDSQPSSWKQISRLVFKGELIEIALTPRQPPLQRFDIRARRAGKAEWLTQLSITIYLGYQNEQ